MIDLKDLMDERSSSTPGFDHLRLGSVQRRATVRRRRRIIATALTAVAALLFGGYALSPALSGKKSAPISVTPSPAADNPDYSSGQHRVAWTEVPVAAGKLELSWTAVPGRQDIDIRCTDAPGAMIRVEINGFSLDPGGICDSQFANAELYFGSAGVRPGELASLTITVLDGGTPDGVLNAAIWVAVPWADYPFPARPAALKPLFPLASCSGRSDVVVLHSDPADPLKPMSINLPPARYLNLVYQTSTPGHLHYGISGQDPRTTTRWDYGAVKGLASVKPGNAAEPTTFAVTPEAVSGPWQIAIIPAEEKHFCIVEQDGPVLFTLP
jgi:hypothetical protein